jgi:hypothetical protein
VSLEIEVLELLSEAIVPQECYFGRELIDPQRLGIDRAIAAGRQRLLGADLSNA